MNLKHWIETYYTVYKKLDLKSGTVDSYLRCLCRVPDDWEYETVSREDVQRLINDLADELAPSTVKHVFTIIQPDHSKTADSTAILTALMRSAL